MYLIKSKFRPSKKVWIDPNTFSVAKKPSAFYLAVSIQSKISEFGGCSLNIEKAMEDLGVKTVGGLKKFIGRLKNEGVVKSVRYTKKAVYINQK